MKRIKFERRISLVLEIVTILWIALSTFSITKGATTAALWQGDKKGVVSITFQGGLPSQFNNAFPILQQHGLKSTFFIISANADQAAVQTLAANGQEIGSQTVTDHSLTTLSHTQLVYELLQSQLYLQQLTGQKIDTLAYPNGDYNTNVMNTAKDYYIVARSADSWQLNSASPDPNQFYKLAVVAPHDNGAGDANAIAYLQYCADKAASEQKWAIEIFHSIGISGGFDTVSSQAFSTHMDYLATNEPNLWVAPMGAVSEYIYERNAASITTLVQDSNTIKLDLHCGLDSRFSTPLTLLTDYPPTWTSSDIQVKQGQMEQGAVVVAKNDNLYIMYDAVPDACTIELSVGESSPIYYTVTASSDANGVIDPNGVITKVRNSDQMFTATPNQDYKVDTWFVDGSAVQAGGNTYNLTQIRANHTVHVIFKPSSSTARTTVALWQGDKQGAVSITLDDDMDTQFQRAFPLLQQHGFKATFFMISENAAEYLTSIQALVADGQEIASHTVTHPYLTTLPNKKQVTELSQSQSDLQQLTGQKIAAVAYPYGDYDTAVMNIARNYYIVARSADSGALNSSSPTVEEFYRLFAIGPHDHYGQGDANAIAGLRYWTDVAIVEDKWFIEIFHGIDYGYDAVSSQAFGTHLDYLTANEPNLWVAPLGTVSEYIQERDKALITTLAQDSNVIKLNLHCGLDSRYSTPLTLFTDCPPDWPSSDIWVKQGQTHQRAAVVSKNGNLYIMYNAVPDAGTIELSPGQVTITVSAEPNGSIEPSGSITKDYGSSQQFTAIPSAGYEVDKWSVDSVEVQTGGTEYTLSNITATHSVVVTFKILTYTVADSAGANGSIDPAGDITKDYGSSQLFTATPSAGYEVDKWSVNSSEVQTGSTEYTLSNISANYTVAVTFKILTYTVAASAGVNGSIDPAGDITKDYGSGQLFTAMPSAGYEVDKWFVDGSEVQTGSTEYTLSNISANHTVAITFKILTYTVSASAGLNGVIAPSGDITKDYGSYQLFTAIPDTGYEVDQWLVDGNSVQNGGATYTLSNVTASHTLTVSFKIFTYTISGYCIEPDGNTPVEGVLIDANSNVGGPDVNDVVSDANGFYELVVDSGWSGTVMPEKEGYTFEPNSNVYTNVTQNYTDANCTALLIALKIFGYVLEKQDGITPIIDVNVYAENGGGPWTSRYGGGCGITDANGYYKVVVDYNWSGKTTPAKYAYAFEPNSIAYTNIIADQNDCNYTGKLLSFAISGYIRNDCNVPIKDVLLIANNGGNSVITDTNGYYEVWVPYNWSGIVTPGKSYYTFTPVDMAYLAVLSDQANQNYRAANICDLDCDGSIDYSDLAIMCGNWLSSDPDALGNFNGDDIVNFLDFAEFAEVW